MNLNIKGEQIDLGFPNPKIKDTPTVYIDKVEVKEEYLTKLNLLTARELYIFGALVKTGYTHPKFGELKRNELVVIERNPQTDQMTEHHLAQFDSVFYKQKDENNGGEEVDMLKKKDILYLNKPPRWKASEASIPSVDNQLFYFAQQFYISANKVNREYIACGETIYVFLYGIGNDQLSVQFFCQDTSEQTAEDHYKLESLMGDFETHYQDLEKVEKLIKQGDKYFHEYVFEHKRTNKDILKILLKYARTKKMKTEIERLLR